MICSKQSNSLCKRNVLSYINRPLQDNAPLHALILGYVRGTVEACLIIRCRVDQFLYSVLRMCELNRARDARYKHSKLTACQHLAIVSKTA
jgi:hypothetical protein